MGRVDPSWHQEQDSLGSGPGEGDVQQDRSFGSGTIYVQLGKILLLPPKCEIFFGALPKW